MGVAIGSFDNDAHLKIQPECLLVVGDGTIDRPILFVGSFSLVSRSQAKCTTNRIYAFTALVCASSVFYYLSLLLKRASMATNDGYFCFEIKRVSWCYLLSRSLATIQAQ